MLGLPTTTISTYRGTTIDQYGDELGSTTVYLSGVPASVIEQSRYVMSQASATPQVVRTVVVRVSAGTDITDTDRIEDERTGAVYEINSVSSIENPLIAGDMRIDVSES